MMSYFSQHTMIDVEYKNSYFLHSNFDEKKSNNVVPIEVFK